MFEFDPYPIEISVAVYDLLPEGKLSSLGWFTGCGLYRKQKGAERHVSMLADDSCPISNQRLCY